MKLLFTAFGTAGDILPVLAIAEEAVKRNHDTLALLSPTHAPLARARNIPTQAYGSPWPTSALKEHPHWLHRSRGSLNMLRELMAPRTAQLIPALRDTLATFQPDAVVHHQATFGVPWLTDATPDSTPIPRVMVAVAPAGWPSIENPSRYPPMPDLNAYPPLAVRIGSYFGRRSVNRAIDPVLNHVRDSIGMPRKRNIMFDEQMSADINIGMWSPHFRTPARDDPPNALIAGFPDSPSATIHDEHQDRTAHANRFVNASDPPPIAITLGTTAVHAGVDTTALALALADRTTRRIIILGSARTHQHPGDRVLETGFIPHALVLPCCAAAVHHAGIGTTAAALQAGIPSVAVPFTHDQPDNARRLRMLRGAVTIDPAKLNPARLAAALDRALNEEHTAACRAFARQLERESAAATACDAIETRIHPRKN